MSIKEVIEQLQALAQHCEQMQKHTSHRPWCDDVQALNIAINILKRYETAVNLIEEYANGKK